MKKIITVMLIGAILTGGMVSAKQLVEKIDVSYNNIKIVIDGKEIATDAEPFIYNGRTYVSARAVAENMGGLVRWNEETQTVDIKNSQKMSMKMILLGADDSNEMYILGTDIKNSINNLTDYRNSLVLGEAKNTGEIHEENLKNLEEIKNILENADIDFLTSAVEYAFFSVKS